ncbi:transcription factor MYB8-like [Punica granatum]|uniref:Uncharacterized protein n=2 Tax=Punica granatum TaxID=22663 RepID=A0A218XLD1_PUNGR|nr:transcription factor MYB8-like [Punica granatum]OWM85694.1 hypothetical protein CDL15_Pgr029117 [Punica granatum]PKI70143.1 hypothetical protein CRG98_009475 [Punica granatum]
MVRTPFSKQNEDKKKGEIKKGPWSAEEDQKLITYIRRYGIWNWTQMPKFAGLARSGKSCRLRWMNYLRPNIKHGNFTKQEEETISKWQQLLGNRWSAIAGKLPGRTDNEIKNYWNTRLKKCVRPEKSTQGPAPLTDNRTSSQLAAPLPTAIESVKSDYPIIFESLSEETSMSSSGSRTSTWKAFELQETSINSLAINDWVNKEASWDAEIAGKSTLLEVANKELDLDYWEEMILPPQEEASLEEDFDSMFMVSSGLLPPAADCSYPEFSTDGHLVYDNLWEN